VFAIVDAVLLRPFPYRDPSNLVFLWGTKSDEVRRGISGPDLQDWREQNQSFTDIDAFLEQMSFSVGDGSETVSGACIGPSVLPILGVTPASGRNFTSAESVGAGRPAVIVSDTFWRGRMGASLSAVGSRLMLNGESFEVVGITPKGFFFPDTNSQILQISPCGMSNYYERGSPTLHAIGRLRDGVSLIQAQADLDLINKRLARAYPDTDSGVMVGLQPLRNIVVGKYERALWLLFGAVALVLLLACANVAHLQLARGMDRRVEFAVRAAIGADRRRLFAQLMVEGLVVASAGTVCAVGAAWIGIRVIRSLSLTDIARIDAAQVDVRLLATAATLALVVTVISGVWPAWKTAGVDVNETLKLGPGTVTRSPRRMARELLATFELTLATVLLVAAGLLVGSFVRLSTATWGFEPNGLLAMSVIAPPGAASSQPALTAWSRLVRARVRALPGVESVTVADGLPLRYAWWPTNVREDGKVISAAGWTIGENYFRTLGTRLLQGREFNERDDESAERVSVISESLAARLWPGRSPLGGLFEIVTLRTVNGKLPAAVEARLRRRDESVFTDPTTTEIVREKVVGVVENIRAFGLDINPEPAFYMDKRQVPAGRGFLRGQRIAVRTRGDLATVTKALTPAVLSVDSKARVLTIDRMSDLVARSIGGRGSARLMMLVSTLFGALTLLLAMSGIFGIVLHSVTQRLPEFGVRIALGSDRGDVARLLLRYAARIIIGGVALGTTAAWAVTRAFRAYVFGVTPADPATYALSVALLVACVLAACIVPIRRAVRCDPTKLLRT
jgi:predicted permease